MSNDQIAPIIGLTPQCPWELASGHPTSIRAEEAWATTRGSDAVTVAIIDAGFDRANIPSTVQVVFKTSSRRRFGVDRSLRGHGTHVAQLLYGNLSGYPGVAPHCRYVLIDLPLVCSEAEERAAFEIALDFDAAVVCCPWGLKDTQRHTRVPDAVADAIESLAIKSRQDRGAVIFLAAPNEYGRVDDYLLQPSVIGVTSVTRDGRCGTIGPGIIFGAPTSGANQYIGGSSQAPPGNSGAVALVAGTAALTMAANSSLTARQVRSILAHTSAPIANPHGSSEILCCRPLLVNAGAAVLLATNTPAEVPHRAAPEARSIAVVSVLPTDRREQRFIGGEHTYLGHLGASALQRILEAASNNVDQALFGGDFAQFTSATTGPVFEPHVLTLVADFLGRDGGPGFDIPTFPHGVRYGYLVGLAADLFNSPVDLGSCVFSEHSHLAKLIWEFDDELDKKFKAVNDNILLTVVPVFERPLFKYLELAERNYSHFAGDNLLFYLSHHLLAVSAAQKCAYTTDSVSGRKFFREALLSEAFALHFLTDMFSSGHARVPRWGWMHGGLLDEGTSDILAKLMHDYEGRHGVFLTNSIDQIWLARGDGGLLDASAIFDTLGNTFLFIDRTAALGVGALAGATTGIQLIPKYLAASLVCASLADVLRHTAKGVAISASGVGNGSAPTGLLGYILNRAPYALPATVPEGFSAAILEQFGVIYPFASFGSRLQDLDGLYQIYQEINPIAKRAKCHNYSTLDEFRAFRDEYLTIERTERAASAQIGHLLSNLSPPSTSAAFLYDVPMLVGGIFRFQSTLLEEYVPDAIVVPPEWKAAVPPKLINALTTDTNGVWRLRV